MTVEGFNQDEGAVVIVESKFDEPPMTRVASILLDVPGGFAWVEPSFLSPIDVRSGHRIDATVREDGAGLAFEGPIFHGRIERPDDGTPEGDAIAWARAEMDRRGLTVDALRERFRADFAPEDEDVDA